jgi:hypothetical protein
MMVQMLDPAGLSKTFVIQDSAGGTQADEAAVIRTLLAAIRSLGRCRQLNPAADYGPLVEPVRKLAKHSNALVRTDAEELSRQLP